MFRSTFHPVGRVAFPQFTGIRVMMLPIVIGDIKSIPIFVENMPLYDYTDVIVDMFRMTKHHGKVGYLTIDEKTILPGQSHRRPGPHVDGVYRGGPGVWAGGAWGGGRNGMLLASSHAQCRAWDQDVTGEPGPEGECEHLADQLRDETSTVLAPGCVYWLDPLCVHESLPVSGHIRRQLVRLSLPSTAPWFEGYTVNPLGVAPTGPILPQREFMAA